MNNRQAMLEAMARAQCRAAGAGTAPVCLQCFGKPEHCMWKSFLGEAEAVLDAMRQFAVVQMRSKPRKE